MSHTNRIESDGVGLAKPNEDALDKKAEDPNREADAKKDGDDVDAGEMEEAETGDAEAALGMIAAVADAVKHDDNRGDVRRGGTTRGILNKAL